MAADHACYQLRFPYTPGHMSAAALERYFFDRFSPLVRILWPSRATVVWADPLLARSDSISYLSVNLNLNGRESKDNALNDKIRELAAAAQAAAPDQWGQLAYVNQWLVDNVVYGNGGNSRSSAGALLDGVAVCQGYANAVQDVCRLLDVPCLYVSNDAHGWNCVYVDGEWLMWDASWNDVPGKTERYFLVDEISGTDSHSYDSVLLALGQQYAVSSKKPASQVMEPVREVVMEPRPVEPSPVVSAQPPITAQPQQTGSAADDLQNAVSYLVGQGVLQGDNSGNLHLDKSLTRAEMAALLVRINGAEQEVSQNAAAYASYCGFSDVPAWAQAYVGYCASQGWVQGYSRQTYGAGDKVNYNAWCTVILRFLGHGETDWSYATAAAKAVSLGLLDSSQTNAGSNSANRGEVARITYRALQK